MLPRSKYFNDACGVLVSKLINILSHCASLDINDCTNSSCYNGATCVDGINNYTCLCSTGYIGDNCNASESINSGCLFRKSSLRYEF